MKIGEAIKHADAQAKHHRKACRNTTSKNLEKHFLGCAAEHEQLVRWLKELQKRRSDDLYNKEFGPTVFHRLFYREHVSRLAERLRRQVASSQKKFKPYNLSLSQIADILWELVHRAEDENTCNDNCKSMYFCDEKRGHKGNHRESSGLIWD